MRGPLTLCLLLAALLVRATHIVGGELYYTALGNDNYEVTLNLFRDCGPGNDLGTGFDATAVIGVFRMSGQYLRKYYVSTPAQGEQVVPVDLSNICLTAPPSICVRQMTYRQVINLPSGQGGYMLSYQRCCRTPTIVNLAPVLQGLTCTVRVPDPAAIGGSNSSPRFNAYPPIALCVGQEMRIDLSASDPDGDELRYDLCAPFIGGDDQFNTIPDLAFSTTLFDRDVGLGLFGGEHDERLATDDGGPSDGSVDRDPDDGRLVLRGCARARLPQWGAVERSGA
ncbi:MAG: hypothetical protein QM724_01690 [Flavobacteriales bacterium]